MQKSPGAKQLLQGFLFASSTEVANRMRQRVAVEKQPAYNKGDVLLLFPIPVLL